MIEKSCCGSCTNMFLVGKLTCCPFRNRDVMIDFICDKYNATDSQLKTKVRQLEKRIKKLEDNNNLKRI